MALNKQNGLVHTVRQVLSHMQHMHEGNQHGGLLLAGDPGIGKAQSLTSKVLTQHGWKRMGDIVVGDVVRTPSGELSSVTGVFPQGLKEIFTITFHDGSKTEVCSEHLWKCRFVETAVDAAQYVVASTADIVEAMNSGRAVHIPVVSQSTRVEATDADRSLTLPNIRNIVDDYEAGNRPLQEYEHGPTYSKYCLIRNVISAFGKLMSFNAAQIHLQNRNMAEDLQMLMWSMGAVASLTTVNPASHTLTVCFDRAWTMAVDAETAPLYRAVASVEVKGQDLAQCIMIDHPDHLYVTDDYVVTHNTTFCNMVGKLLGVDVITIEVPHVVEEHLINIPFIVFNSKTGNTSTGSVDGKIGEDDYRLVLADSHLYQQMAHVNKVSDGEYLEYIRRQPAVIQNLFVALGGTQDTIPPAIQRARQHYSNVLFLDEFYRQTSTRIRNVLRSILNGNIGMHRIPAYTYVIYASNMRDSGLDDIPQNHQFSQLNFKAPNKKEWFAWLSAQYADNHSIKLNPKIISAFQKALDDEDISYHDAASDVRTSPRRWEQIILYVNGSLPVSAVLEATTLMTNVRNSFIHHGTEDYSSLSSKVMKALAEVIKDTSNIEVDSDVALPSHEWRHALQHAISQLMKSGKFKRHVPVISGPPGIGKTKFVHDVSTDLGLLLIDIDVSELFPDDVTGNPLPAGQYGDHNIRVKFSLPKLYYTIMRRIEEKDAAYKKHLKEEYPTDADARIAQYQQQRWKYLIFFDELNRCDTRTFNSLRRVMLEKNFGADDKGGLLELPAAALVIGAWNPDPDTGGTTDVTSHFADVVDVIPARASWGATRRFLMSKKFATATEEITRPAMLVIDAFVQKFELPSNTHNGKHISDEQRPFFLDFNGMPVYYSPREYTDMYSSIIRALGMCMEDLRDETDATVEERRHYIDEYVGDAIVESITFPLTKAGIPVESVEHNVRGWAASIPDSTYSGLLSRRVESASSHGSVVERYMDSDDIEKMPTDPNVVNNHNVLSHAEIIDDLIRALSARLKTDAGVEKYITDATQPAIIRNGDELERSSDRMTSRLRNFMMGLIYTLKIHEYEHDRMAAVGSALSQAGSKIVTMIRNEGGVSRENVNAATKAIMAIRTEIQKAIVND